MEHGRSARARVLRTVAVIIVAMIVSAMASLGVAVADTPTDTGSATAASTDVAATPATDTTTDSAPPSSDSPADPGSSSAAVPTDPATSSAATDSGSGTNGVTSPTDTSGTTATDGSTSVAVSPSPQPNTTSTSDVSGGNGTSVSNLSAASVLPSVALMRNAITAFASTLLDALPGGAAPELRSGDGSGAVCRCTVSLAVAVHGDAFAVANPSLPASPDPDAPPATAVPGPTGFANSVAISAHGDAASKAASGSVGAGSASTSVQTQTAGDEIVQTVSMDSATIAAAVNTFSEQMLTANGAVATTLDIAPCRTGCTGFTHGSVQIATMPSPGGDAQDCWAADLSSLGGTSCTIAIAIAFIGHAHASVVVAAGGPAAPTPTVPCGSALAGGATSASIAAKGDAHALASMGTQPTCIAPIPDAMHAGITPSATSASGATGNGLGVAVAADGDASSTTASGNSGPVIANGGPASGDSSAAASTGATGDAIGIALAKLSATTQVHSGNSGKAGTVCAGCSGATTPNGGNAVAVAASGNTGLSFSLAVAGLQAAVQSNSGDSGDSIGLVMDGPGVSGTGAAGQTGANGGTNGDPGTAYVAGRSGNTGDTVVVAIGMTTWVDVLGYTGRSGPVLSTATWGDSGCTFAVDSLTTMCPSPSTSPAPAPGGSTGGPSAASVPGGPRGTPIPPAAVSAALFGNQPLQVATLTETKRGRPDTVPPTRVESTAVTGGKFGIPAAQVSHVVNSAPASTWSVTAEIGIAAVVLILVVMACRYGRGAGDVNSS